MYTVRGQVELFVVITLELQLRMMLISTNCLILQIVLAIPNYIICEL